MDEWIEILDGIDKTDYPLDLVSTITFTSDSFNNKELDFDLLRNVGYNSESLNEILIETVREFSKFEDSNMEFEFNLIKIKAIAEEGSEQYLKLIKG